ncbi:9382_t:CDS:1, partial [Funneliformis geosporum]
ASVLTPEQVEEIRSLKNKVSAYMIVRDYHINKNCVSDIWDDSERLQQSGDYVLADILSKTS